MERPQKLREACRDAYAGKFGELPAQEGLEKDTKFGVKTFPAYMYPVTWLAEFLSSYRENFPIHWKNF